MTHSPLATEVFEKIAAGFAGLYIQSAEHEDALEELRRLCAERGWPIAYWDTDVGLMEYSAAEGAWVTSREQNGPPLSPVAAVKLLPKLNAGLGDAENPVYGVLVLKNGHRVLDGPLFQLALNQVAFGKKSHQVLVVLSPLLKQPPEYEVIKAFDVIEHALPDREQLQEVAAGVAGEAEMPAGEELEKLLDAGAGLTRLGMENACALSLVRHDRLVPGEIFAVKQQALKTTQGLVLHAGKERFPDVGGLDFMKTYCLQTLTKREPNPKFRCRGILIMGVSGGGKSLFAKALGNEVERPTLHFDINATFGSLLGQTQHQFRHALATADAMAPCILFMDEVEKALSGVQGSARTDGGVKAGVFGNFLTWMQDHTSDVFLIATCNDIRKLSEDNPEIIRRFDNLFFVDFPGREAKEQIWKIHLRGYELWDGQSDYSQVALPVDDEWTGAEIEVCCRQARLRGLPVADVGKHMPRIVDQARETIEAARAWAKGRAYAAEYEGLYEPEAHLAKMAITGNGSPRRRIGRMRT